MPKLLPALALVLVLMAIPAGPGSRAQSQTAAPPSASIQGPSWVTVGLVVGGAFLGRYLAQRYLSDWRIVQWLAARAGAGVGAEAAGLATAL